MKQNIIHAITKYLKHNKIMTTTIITNASDQIINLRYSHNKKSTTLLKLLRSYKKILNTKHTNLSEQRALLNPLGKILTLRLYELTEFRSFYNSQFPKKEKPQKYKLKKHKYIKLTSSSGTRGPEEQISYDYTFNYYDIFKRIEKILGYQLIYSDLDASFYPKHLYDEIIEPIFDNNNKPKAVIRNILKTDNLPTYIELNNKKYHLNCFKQLFADSLQRNKEWVLIWKKVNTKRCYHCDNEFIPTVKFKYSNMHDQMVCEKCYLIYAKYTQPQFTSNSITNHEYHSNRSGFKFIICKNNYDNSIPIGMELETELKVKEFHTTKNNIAFALWNALDKKDIVFERDGSLNSAGIEIITNPMTLSYARTYWEKGTKALANLTNGIYSGLEDYKQVDETTAWWGIHLTTARKYWTDFALIKLTNFFTNKENKLFLQTIAQRTHIYGGSEIGGLPTTNRPKLIFIDHSAESNTGEKIKSLERNTCINMTKKKLIEFRLFQSTNKTDEILKNYDFITALNIWFTQHETTMQPTANEFISWLVKDKNRLKQFKYLTKYLQKPHMQIRMPKTNDIKIFKNPWKELFNIDISNFWKKEPTTCV